MFICYEYIMYVCIVRYDITIALLLHYEKQSKGNDELFVNFCTCHMGIMSHAS